MGQQSQTGIYQNVTCMLDIYCDNLLALNAKTLTSGIEKRTSESYLHLTWIFMKNKPTCLKQKHAKLYLQLNATAPLITFDQKEDFFVISDALAAQSYKQRESSLTHGPKETHYHHSTSISLLLCPHCKDTKSNKNQKCTPRFSKL